MTVLCCEKSFSSSASSSQKCPSLTAPRCFYANCRHSFCAKVQPLGEEAKRFPLQLSYEHSLQLFHRRNLYKRPLTLLFSGRRSFLEKLFPHRHAHNIWHSIGIKRYFAAAIPSEDITRLTAACGAVEISSRLLSIAKQLCTEKPLSKSHFLWSLRWCSLKVKRRCTNNIH